MKNFLYALSVGSSLAAHPAFAQETAPPAPKPEPPAAPAEQPDAPSPAESEPTPEKEPAQPAETESPTQPSTEASEAEGSQAIEGEEAAPAESESASQGEGAAEPPAESTSEQAEPSTSAEPPSPEKEEARPPELTRHTASANQATEIPQDDYAGASDQELVPGEEERKNLSLGIALDLTWPLGSAANYIDSASLQGLSLDLRYYAWGNIGIGVGVALDSLSQKNTSTVVWDNATITGTQVRELSYTPIVAKGYYAWRDNERFIPYLAAGVGAARAVRRLIAGFSSLSEDSWHFALVPEAGLQIPVGPTVLLTNARLNYLPASSGVDDQVFANVSFGLSIQ